MHTVTDKIDVLVIGCGIAGLSAALAAADQGYETLVVSCAPELEESNSVHAQGGIIYKAHEGDPSLLENDIAAAGSRVNYTPALKQLCELGPKLVDEILIKRAEVPFDRSSDGSLDMIREGGHSADRIIHKGDESGRAIEQSLLQLCENHPKIQFRAATTAVNLLMTSYHPKDRAVRFEEARCFGAFLFDQRGAGVYPLYAAHTVLATGGIGQLFLHSTNSKYARGDGIALAHRAGCRLDNLEFIQFHPTTFFHPQSRRFLISEALRGEGALLLNRQGERFLPKYLPEFAVPELAPRDRVARAIHHEMLATGEPCVFLDISGKNAESVRSRFPVVYRSCLQHGVDITKQPIPVVPGAHYHCGGVWTDLAGRTSVTSLWAVGETACTGLHGANRLASTSLLEGLVWGTRAGTEIANELKGGRPAFPEIDPWKSESMPVDAAFLSQDWHTLKNTMWNYVGLIKTEARLARAQGVLTELEHGIELFYRRAALSDSLIGLRHATLAAVLIVEAAKKNSRSLGCYLREDLEVL